MKFQAPVTQFGRKSVFLIIDYFLLLQVHHLSSWTELVAGSQGGLQWQPSSTVNKGEGGRACSCRAAEDLGGSQRKKKRRFAGQI